MHAWDKDAYDGIYRWYTKVYTMCTWFALCITCSACMRQRPLFVVYAQVHDVLWAPDALLYIAHALHTWFALGDTSSAYVAYVVHALCMWFALCARCTAIYGTCTAYPLCVTHAAHIWSMRCVGDSLCASWYLSLQSTFVDLRISHHAWNFLLFLPLIPPPPPSSSSSLWTATATSNFSGAPPQMVQSVSLLVRICVLGR